MAAEMHSSKSCMKPKRGRKEKKKPQKPGVPRLSSLFAARPSSRANILGPLTSTAAPDVKARLFSCPVLMRLRKSQSGSPATIHGSPFGASASSSVRPLLVLDYHFYFLFSLPFPIRFLVPFRAYMCTHTHTQPLNPRLEEPVLTCAPPVTGSLRGSCGLLRCCYGDSKTDHQGRISIRTPHPHPPSPARSIWVQSGSGCVPLKNLFPGVPRVMGWTCRVRRRIRGVIWIIMAFLWGFGRNADCGGTTVCLP